MRRWVPDHAVDNTLGDIPQIRRSYTMAPPTYIHGQLDEAEELALGALQVLPNECIIYAQPKLVYKYEVRYPDFVIVYHEWGVVVLEVKDWIEVVDRNGKEARIRQRNGRLKWRDSPIEQVRGAALERMFNLTLSSY
jgi:hypothetical protein